MSLGAFLNVMLAGELAQMVERSLSMREVAGSMPAFSKNFFDCRLAVLLKVQGLQQIITCSENGMKEQCGQIIE